MGWWGCVWGKESAGSVSLLIKGNSGSFCCCCCATAVSARWRYFQCLWNNGGRCVILLSPCIGQPTMEKKEYEETMPKGWVFLFILLSVLPKDLLIRASVSAYFSLIYLLTFSSLQFFYILLVNESFWHYWISSILLPSSAV